MRVVAYFSDGSSRDVTRQAVYQTNEPELAEVSESGVVEAKNRSGRFTVMVRYGDQIGLFDGALPVLYADPRADAELDAIVRKAMEPEPAHRYESADALAADVARYLNHEPLEARRASTWYVLRKHARRHRVSLLVAACFGLLLAGSSVAGWREWKRAMWWAGMWREALLPVARRAAGKYNHTRRSLRSA